MLLGLWLGPRSTTKTHLCSVSCTGFRCPSTSSSNCSCSPTRPCMERPPCTCVSLLFAIDLDAHSALQMTPLTWLSGESRQVWGSQFCCCRSFPVEWFALQYEGSGVSAPFQEAVKDLTLWAHVRTVIWTFSWVDWTLGTFILGPLSMRAKPCAKKVACMQLCRPVSIAVFPRAGEFCHAEKLLDAWLFGVPKHVGCVYGHNAHVHDLAEVNTASMDEELFLLILCHCQRNRLNRMRLTLLALKSCQHRY